MVLFLGAWLCGCAADEPTPFGSPAQTFQTYVVAVQAEDDFSFALVHVVHARAVYFDIVRLEGVSSQVLKPLVRRPDNRHA